jgi:cobalt/nickel transport system permease protein
VFSLVSWLAGDAQRAIAIPVKSYMSCLAAVLLIGTTTLPAILRALSAFHVPRSVLLVAQFVYRYIFVLFEQASAMRRAASCRGGSLARNRSLFQAAAGTLAVLFGKSYDRAEGIHNAMISRGFTGSIAVLRTPALRIADVLAFASLGAVIVLSWMML